MIAVSKVLPPKVYPFIETIIYDLYKPSPTAILSVTTIFTLWSAARGMLSIERGLNRIFQCGKRRNYVLSRLISSGYTIVFMLVCVMSLLLLVFGSFLQKLLIKRVPLLMHLSPYMLSMRSLISLFILIIFFTGLYTFLPYKNQLLKYQVPGAVFSTICWILFSYGFSIYFNNFSQVSYMYGSLTAVVLLMLWLYFCICILFIGAEINQNLFTMRRYKR